MGAAGFRDKRGEEADRVLDNLRRIVCVLYGHSRRVERLARLTSAQAWLITTLSRMETAKVSDLARAMHLNHTTVVRIVSRLEERGLVVRTRRSTDHAIVKVALTHLGMKLPGRIPAIPQALLLTGLSEIPPDRLRAISEGLESLTRILGAGNAAPLLFFAPVANLPEVDPIDRHRIASPLREARATLERGRSGRGQETERKGKGHDPENVHSESGVPPGAARRRHRPDSEPDARSGG